MWERSQILHWNIFFFGIRKRFVYHFINTGLWQGWGWFLFGRVSLWSIKGYTDSKAHKQLYLPSQLFAKLDYLRTVSLGWLYVTYCHHNFPFPQCLLYSVLGLSWWCRAWLNLASQVDNWGNAIACIGETTASAAKKFGLKSIYYPTTPGLDG